MSCSLLYRAAKASTHSLRSSSRAKASTHGRSIVSENIDPSYVARGLILCAPHAKSRRNPAAPLDRMRSHQPLPSFANSGGNRQRIRSIINDDVDPLVTRLPLQRGEELSSRPRLAYPRPLGNDQKVDILSARRISYPRAKQPSLHPETELSQRRLLRSPRWRARTSACPQPQNETPCALRMRSASTIIRHNSSSVVFASQPSSRFALSGLPISRSTSAGR